MLRLCLRPGLRWQEGPRDPVPGGRHPGGFCAVRRVRARNGVLHPALPGLPRQRPPLLRLSPPLGCAARLQHDGLRRRPRLLPHAPHVTAAQLRSRLLSGKRNTAQITTNNTCCAGF